MYIYIYIPMVPSYKIIEGGQQKIHSLGKRPSPLHGYDARVSLKVWFTGVLKYEDQVESEFFASCPTKFC